MNLSPHNRPISPNVYPSTTNHPPTPTKPHRNISQTPNLLDLVNNLARPSQTLNHLLALLPSPDREITLLEQLIQFRSLVHVLQQLALHFLFGPLDKVQHDGFGNHVDHCSADDVEVGCDQQF